MMSRMQPRCWLSCVSTQNKNIITCRAWKPPCTARGHPTYATAVSTPPTTDTQLPNHIQPRIVDNFLTDANDLRAHFDQRFSKPREFDGRFVWDYWHVPNQYTLLRTPADGFFPQPLYESLERQLLQYGMQHLGCRALTPVWLSYYVEGCRQELHTDSPHGPWAFVLSLTQWDSRRFSGGETQLLRSNVLDYWGAYEGYGQERGALVQLIEPQFNRLSLFDPRVPHGVVPVHGVHDPREARIVLHGWFAEPEPYFEGPLEEQVMVECLNDIMDSLVPELQELPEVTGTLVVRATVAPDGRIPEAGVCFLTDTMVLRPWSMSDEEPSATRRAVREEVVRQLCGYTFPTAQGSTEITLPLAF